VFAQLQQAHAFAQAKPPQFRADGVLAKPLRYGFGFLHEIVFLVRPIAPGFFSLRKAAAACSLQ
jgi:hypothetical protein